MKNWNKKDTVLKPKGDYFPHYPSVESFIEDITTGDFEIEKSKTGCEEFTGTKSFEESIKIAREGIHLGEVDVALVDAYHNKTDERWDVEGGQIDVGLWMSGEPECFLNFMEVESHKFAEITVNISESSGTPAHIFDNKAIATASLVDRLEANNYRVKLNVAAGIRIDGRILVPTITIKDYQQKMSIAQLTGCIHRGFFRRLFFAFIEKYTVNPDMKSYGIPADLVGIDGVVLPRSDGSNLNSPDSIEKYIQTALLKITETN